MEQQNKITLLRLSNGKHNELLFWSIDPKLNQALSLAQADNLIEIDGSKYKLTNKGDSFATKIIENKINNDDIEFLKLVGKRINESMISNIQRIWD